MATPTYLIIATIAPVTLQCKHALYHRHNRHHFISYPPSRRSHYAVKLDFNALLGQLCFSFGSTRASDIWLRGIEGVDMQHFALFLDLETRRLCIKDTSHTGTTVIYKENQHIQASQGASRDSLQGGSERLIATLQRGRILPVTTSMLVSCGKRNDACFKLHLSEEALHQSCAFAQCLLLYARSIALWGPRLPVGSGSSKRLHVQVAEESAMQHSQRPRLTRPDGPIDAEQAD